MAPIMVWHQHLFIRYTLANLSEIKVKILTISLNYAFRSIFFKMSVILYRHHDLIGRRRC